MIKRDKDRVQQDAMEDSSNVEVSNHAPDAEQQTQAREQQEAGKDTHSFNKVVHES